MRGSRAFDAVYASSSSVLDFHRNTGPGPPQPSSGQRRPGFVGPVGPVNWICNQLHRDVSTARLTPVDRRSEAFTRCVWQRHVRTVATSTRRRRLGVLPRRRDPGVDRAGCRHPTGPFWGELLGALADQSALEHTARYNDTTAMMNSYANNPQPGRRVWSFRLSGARSGWLAKLLIPAALIALIPLALLVMIGLWALVAIGAAVIAATAVLAAPLLRRLRAVSPAPARVFQGRILEGESRRIDVDSRPGE